MPHGETACFVRIVFHLKAGLLLPKRKSVTMGRESHRKNAKASFRSLWGELTSVSVCACPGSIAIAPL